MVFQLDHRIIFPDPFLADPSGLLAVGGDLSVERLLLAYQNGIFPWYGEDEPILWYATNPRFVLCPQEVKISKSMKQLMRKGKYSVTMNRCFEQVMQECASVPRFGQSGTWIHPEMIQAYQQLHAQGFALSIEVWENNSLVGGLYGVKIGQCFYGESMFHKQSNTSKIALISLCKSLDVSIIDCQTYTPHLESMGAKMIMLEDFLAITKKKKR